ncbi:MAG: hypothetical protein QNJ55_17860 [Xenococcus sp. MO_188.B8]|nr:hypothetical protein [Xenococcus sp. MO_188.B8]
MGVGQIDMDKQKITELRNYLKQTTPEILPADTVAEILIDINPEHDVPERQRNSIFIMSSDTTDRLFHMEGSLVGVTLEDVFKIVKPRIEPNQWKHFANEQDQLLAKLLTGQSNILATIPFIFKNSELVSEDLRGKAFLALITQYSFEKDSLLLKMRYHEVSNQLKKAPDGNYYIYNSKSRS